MTESVFSYETDQSSICMLPTGTRCDGGDTAFMLSVAIISTFDIGKSLKEAMLEYQAKHKRDYKFELLVHTAERVKAVLCNSALHIDFFIMLADPRKADIAEKVSRDLQRLPPVVLAAGRCVITVAWPPGIPPCMVGNCSEAVHEFGEQHMLHKIVQHTEGVEGEWHLADRLLRLARMARGLNSSGIPNFTGCFNPGPFWACQSAGGVLSKDMTRKQSVRGASSVKKDSHPSDNSSSNSGDTDKNDSESSSGTSSSKSSDS